MNINCSILLVDGYIAVHLPGHLTHLLCVGVECDVGLHIIHHGMSNM